MIAEGGLNGQRDGRRVVIDLRGPERDELLQRETDMI